MAQEEKIVHYAAGFEGVSPILMNPATEDLLNELEGGAGARKGKNLGETKHDKAQRKIIKNDDGQIGIPAEYLFACLVEAGRLVKLDAKRSISTKESTLLPSFLTIEEIFFPFNDQNIEWKVDRRRGKLPKDGTAVCITRPRFDKWGFSATFTVDQNEVSEEKVKLLIDKAGSCVGLGDFRPACRGPFGRFRRIKWEKLKGAESG